MLLTCIRRDICRAELGLISVIIAIAAVSGQVSDCGIPASIADGTVSFTATIVGATAKYSCNDAYLIDGSEVLTCQSDTDWTGTLPQCVLQVTNTDTDISVAIVIGIVIGAFAFVIFWIVVCVKRDAVYTKCEAVIKCEAECECDCCRMKLCCVICCTR